MFAIAHELSPTTEHMLREKLLDFVIDQQVDATLTRAIKVMLAEMDEVSRVENAEHFIPFTLYCVENL